MSIDRAGIEALARRLQQGGAGALTAGELDAVLSWLGGGQRHGALQLTDRIGRPEQRPELVANLYRWLDRQLLGQGCLDPAAAHLDARGPEAETKARFRRLIQAFHPDRYPELAAWLTPRAQLIHGAYAAFKRGEPWAKPVLAAASGVSAGQPPGGKAGQAAKPSAAVEPAWTPGPYRRSARLVPDSEGAIQRLGRRLSHAPGMGRLLIAAIAAVVLLPLLLIHWADEGTALPSAGPERTAGLVPGAAATAHSHPLRVDLALTAATETPAAREPEPARMAMDDPLDVAIDLETGQLRISQLLQNFGQYVNHGDLDGLLRLAGPQSSGAGIEQLAERYGRVIAQSRRRHQEFQVLSIEHHGTYWSVQALSRLTMAFDDLTARHEEARLRIMLLQEPDGQFRIVGFDG